MARQKFLIIPPSLVKSAQKAQTPRTTWWAVSVIGKTHRWTLPKNEPIGMENLIEWLKFIASEEGCPLEVVHRGYSPLTRTLFASGTVTRTS